LIADAPADGGFRRLTLVHRGHVLDAAPAIAAVSKTASETAAAANELHAPLPGTIIRVTVSPGDAVEDGQTLAVIESMKMEHRITAPRAGKVEKLLCSQGQTVRGGDTLIVLEANAEASGSESAGKRNPKPAKGKVRK